LLHSVDPNMIQGLLTFCTFLLTILCDTLMFMLKLRQFRIGLHCRRVRYPFFVHYGDHVTTTPWPLMLDLHAHRSRVERCWEVWSSLEQWRTTAQQPYGGSSCLYLQWHWQLETQNFCLLRNGWFHLLGLEIMGYHMPLLFPPG